jgi:hypothetical protein
VTVRRVFHPLGCRQDIVLVLQKISEEPYGRELSCSLCLDRHSKQASDQGDLTGDISFDHPVHLPFADHIHALVPL